MNENRALRSGLRRPGVFMDQRICRGLSNGYSCANDLQSILRAALRRSIDGREEAEQPQESSCG
jgi:hypothetical protein